MTFIIVGQVLCNYLRIIGKVGTEHRAAERKTLTRVSGEMKQAGVSGHDNDGCQVI